MDQNTCTTGSGVLTDTHNVTVDEDCDAGMQGKTWLNPLTKGPLILLLAPKVTNIADV
jgi:hypothetical protein